MKININPYQIIDNGIMSCVNSGVRAWNWTTGQTKKDLANKLLCVAPILEVSGMIQDMPAISLVLAPMLFILSHFTQIYNEHLEKEEENSIRNGCLVAPEKYHPYEKTGIIFAGNSLILLGLPPYRLEYNVWGIGSATRSLSSYVMRAEYLPPKKSAFRRAKEGLEKWVKELQSAPDLNPSPSPAFFDYLNEVRGETR